MRNNNVPPCCSEIVETEAPNVIADNDDVCSGHLRPAIRIFEQHSSKICVVGKKHLDRHKKKTPSSSRSRGFYRLLPQLKFYRRGKVRE